MFEDQTDRLVLCTTRIKTYKDDGEGFATGFYYFHRTHHESEAIQRGVGAIVTNRHVLQGANSVEINLTLKQDGHPQIGSYRTVLLSGDDMWVGHPDSEVDLALIPWRQVETEWATVNDEAYIEWINADLIPTESIADRFSTIEDVLLIGYPDGIWDSRNNLPVVRRGITATPLRTDYEGQAAFIIDAAVFSGSSGSPVFVVHRPGRALRGTPKGVEGISMGSAIYLVGVVSHSYTYTAEGEMRRVPVPVSRRSPKRPVIDVELALGHVQAARLLRDWIAEELRDARSGTPSE